MTVPNTYRAPVRLEDMHPDVLLNTSDVCTLLNRTPWTLRDWRLKKIGPKCILTREGSGESARRYGYRVADLCEWLKSRPRAA